MSADTTFSIWMVPDFSNGLITSLRRFYVAVSFFKSKTNFLYVNAGLINVTFKCANAI